MFRSRWVATTVAATALVGGSLVAALTGPAGARPERPAAPAAGIDDTVHLNEIQTIGSHNSYHRVPSAAEVKLRRSFIGDGDDLMEYQHEPLPVQFQSQKVRQIELDVFVDNAGGKYTNPLMRTVAGLGPWHPDVMNKPGLKVFHIQDVDYVSTCLTLKDCLTQIKGWSDANPSHVPIAILMELKDTPLNFGDLKFTMPEPFNAAAMDQVDAEIRSVFAPGDLITPDDVRGSHSTLEEAVLAHDAWPTLGESRGKVMFLMDNGGGYRTTYLAGHPNLTGRVLFTNAKPGQADAAFVEHNDSADVAEIQDLVRKGYVVRTRADGDTVEARENNTVPRDNALASGAQWVSTDYPMPGMAVGFSTPYSAQIPGGTVARCNPVNGPEGCVSADLDTIFTPLPPPTTPTTTTPPSVPGSTTTTPSGGVGPADGARPTRARPSYTG